MEQLLTKEEKSNYSGEFEETQHSLAGVLSGNHHRASVQFFGLLQPCAGEGRSG
jgi:hypothetical protein